jgi:hypothetical protein
MSLVSVKSQSTGKIRRVSREQAQHLVDQNVADYVSKTEWRTQKKTAAKEEAQRKREEKKKERQEKVTRQGKNKDAKTSDQ